MSMNGLDRRLQRLEQDSAGAPVMVWRDKGDTIQAALARRGISPADRGKVIILSWMEPVAGARKGCGA